MKKIIFLSLLLYSTQSFSKELPLYGDTLGEGTVKTLERILPDLNSKNYGDAGMTENDIFFDKIKKFKTQIEKKKDPFSKEIVFFAGRDEDVLYKNISFGNEEWKKNYKERITTALTILKKSGYTVYLVDMTALSEHKNPEKEEVLKNILKQSTEETKTQYILPNETIALYKGSKDTIPIDDIYETLAKTLKSKLKLEDPPKPLAAPRILVSRNDLPTNPHIKEAENIPFLEKKQKEKNKYPQKTEDKKTEEKKIMIAQNTLKDSIKKLNDFKEKEEQRNNDYPEEDILLTETLEEFPNQRLSYSLPYSIAYSSKEEPRFSLPKAERSSYVLVKTSSEL